MDAQSRLIKWMEHARWEVRQGTPEHIASQGLFDKVVEALDANEDLERKIEDFESRVLSAADDADEKRERLREEVANLERKIDLLEDEKTDLGMELNQARARIRELSLGMKENA